MNQKLKKLISAYDKDIDDDNNEEISKLNLNENNSKTKNKIRNKLILTLLYSSGIRVSELVSLLTKDIDLEDRTMRIRGKGDKDRVVLFDNNAKSLIKKIYDYSRI
ncbi:tyrosine-type recombinase/integrase [Methanobrevibacter arboriphilus]|uniref:tyrosine-type recombinase/integrase n=1 Tax=Methanobrevibacter arboriphilus TaxID=39441 RepID=UPI000A99F1D1|nr:tyrosine-type recombinase/integrase [Methanobrevibacter arboriphilus]